MPSTIDFDRPPARRRPAGSIAMGCALVLVFGAALAWFAVGTRLTTNEQRWERAAGFSPLVAYPPRDANAEALHIERLGARLGMEIGREGRTHVDPTAKARWKALTPELKAYFAALRVPSPSLAPPAPGLSAFLAESEPTLREARESVLTSEPPRWELHLERGMDYDVPNLGGHVHLQRLLLVAAGEAARAGSYDESARWLAASHRLQAALAEDPLLIQQLLAMSELGSELTLSRALEKPPAGWRAQLSAIDRRESMERALRLDGWMFAYAVRTGQLDRKVHTVGLGHLLLRVVGRLGASQIEDSVEDAIAELRRRDMRGFDADAFDRKHRSRIPRWNLAARLSFPFSIEAPARAARNRLDVELTEQVLAARERIAAGGAPALTAFADHRPSSVRGFVWLYDRRPDALVIRANGDLLTNATSALPLTVRIPLQARRAPHADAPGSL